MPITVHHRNWRTHGPPPINLVTVPADSSWPDGYKMVAIVDTDDLNTAYEDTNTINIPWWDNATIIDAKPPCRSTSVGDILEDTDTGEFHIVASFGFLPFDATPPNVVLFEGSQ